MAKFLFVSDLDNTFVGDDAALIQLMQLLSQSREEYGTKIVYATGRSPILYLELKNAFNLMQPDALILSVGTEIFLDHSDIPDERWSATLSSGWNREVVLSKAAEFPQLQLQPHSEQRPFKASFFLREADAPNVLPQLKDILIKSGQDIKIIYSSGIDLDIVPRASDKGQAMQFLRHQWEFTAEQTVVCGDSGNDIALFSVGQERGVIVGNARAELLKWHKENPADFRYLASKQYAGGILEGLKYFKFL